MKQGDNRLFYPLKQCVICRKLTTAKAKRCEKCGHEFRTDFRQILRGIFLPSTFLGYEMVKYEKLALMFAVMNCFAFLKPISGIFIALATLFLNAQGFQPRDRAKDRELRAGFYCGVVGLIASFLMLHFYPKGIEPFRFLKADGPGYFRPRLPGEQF